MSFRFHNNKHTQRKNNVENEKAEQKQKQFAEQVEGAYENKKEKRKKKNYGSINMVGIWLPHHVKVMYLVVIVLLVGWFLLFFFTFVGVDCFTMKPLLCYIHDMNKYNT